MRAIKLYKSSLRLLISARSTFQKHNDFTMWDFFKSRQHSKAGSVIPHEQIEAAHLPDGEEHPPETPEDYTPRENAFDTARRLHGSLHRDSDSSYYSRAQDEQGEDDTKPLPALPPSPTDTIPNASYLFWSSQRSEMWANHVASIWWPTVNLKDGISYKKALPSPTDMPESASRSKTGPEDEPEPRVEKSFEEKPKYEVDIKAKVKSDATKLPRGPKLTLQIPRSDCKPMQFRMYRPCITNEERAEWKKNMF